MAGLKFNECSRSVTVCAMLTRSFDSKVGVG